MHYQNMAVFALPFQNLFGAEEASQFLGGTKNVAARNTEVNENSIHRLLCKAFDMGMSKPMAIAFAASANPNTLFATNPKTQRASYSWSKNRWNLARKEAAMAVVATPVATPAEKTHEDVVAQIQKLSKRR